MGNIEYNKEAASLEEMDAPTDPKTEPDTAQDPSVTGTAPEEAEKKAE